MNLYTPSLFIFGSGVISERDSKSKSECFLFCVCVFGWSGIISLRRLRFMQGTLERVSGVSVLKMVKKRRGKKRGVTLEPHCLTFTCFTFPASARMTFHFLLQVISPCLIQFTPQPVLHYHPPSEKPLQSPEKKK